MNTFSLIFISFYLLLFFFYGFIFFKRFAPKNPQQTIGASFLAFLKNTKMWLGMALAFCSAMALFLPIGFLTEWIVSPSIIKLKKIGRDDVFLLKATKEKIYTDLVYQNDGTPYSIFWDHKKIAFFLEEITKEKNKKSFLLKKSPFSFAENSNLSYLPLSSTLSDGKTIKMHHLGKKIKVSWQGQSEKMVPHSIEEKSQLGLDYALGDKMFFLSYIPRGEIFNRIFMHRQDFVPRSLTDEKTKGHFHSPYYWRAKKALFFTGIERKSKKNGEKVFISSLYLKSFAEQEKKIILKMPLAESKSLSLFVLKISGSPDGQFFAHHDAITQKNFLIFYWMKNKNYPFTLSWENLKTISSFALSPIQKNKESYAISLLGINKTGQPIIITSQIAPKKNKAHEKNVVETALTIILSVLGIILYCVGIWSLKVPSPSLTNKK